MRQFTAGILGCIVLSACTLSVQDRTAGPLVYNDPKIRKSLRWKCYQAAPYSVLRPLAMALARLKWWLLAGTFIKLFWISLPGAEVPSSP